jgi:hypothetical protein
LLFLEDFLKIKNHLLEFYTAANFAAVFV